MAKNTASNVSDLIEEAMDTGETAALTVGDAVRSAFECARDNGTETDEEALDLMDEELKNIIECAKAARKIIKEAR